MDKRRPCTICRLDLRDQAVRVKGMRFRRRTSYECRACPPTVALCGPVTKNTTVIHTSITITEQFNMEEFQAADVLQADAKYNILIVTFLAMAF